MSALGDLAERSERAELIVVGLMSGTSADAVDAAVVRVAGAGEELGAELIAAVVSPYRDEFRDRVIAAGSASAEELARLDLEIADVFATAALEAIDVAGLDTSDVDVIGSHGQTVAHVPGGGVAGPNGRLGAATLQLGSAARIAERTGLAVVSDFRSRDVAAGGEGAPLVPYVDWLLLRLTNGVRLAQNLGGVGNVTLVTPDRAQVVAFDTGPANGPIDAAVALLSGGRLLRDEGGETAASGRVCQAEVDRLLAEPWFRTAPPRSLSRDVFGEGFVSRFVERRADLAGADVIATLTEFVARSIRTAYDEHLGLGTRSDVVEVVVSGGGVHNVTLMRRLSELLAPLPVVSSGERGVDPDAKEALAFAILAAETLRSRAGNLPSVTGAAGQRVLGSLTLA